MFKLFLSLVLLFFSGCAVKKVVKKESYIITIKSKKFRFNDYGIIEKFSDESLVIKIYSAGNLIKELKVNSKICTDEGCLKKEKFNEIYLSRLYPKDFLKNVILGKPIFDSENIIKKNSGFEQKIFRNNQLDIIYIVNSKSIYFKDRKNKILIKIRRVE